MINFIGVSLENISKSSVNSLIKFLNDYGFELNGNGMDNLNRNGYLVINLNKKFNVDRIKAGGEVTLFLDIGQFWFSQMFFGTDNSVRISPSNYLTSQKEKLEFIKRELDRQLKTHSCKKIVDLI